MVGNGTVDGRQYVEISEFNIHDVAIVIHDAYTGVQIKVKRQSEMIGYSQSQAVTGQVGVITVLISSHKTGPGPGIGVVDASAV